MKLADGAADGHCRSRSEPNHAVALLFAMRYGDRAPKLMTYRRRNHEFNAKLARRADELKMEREAGKPKLLAKVLSWIRRGK